MGKQNTILVTGAGGLLGRELVQLLAAAGCRVIAVASSARRLPRVSGKSVVWVSADIRAPQPIKTIMLRYRPSVIFHAAASIPRTGQPQDRAELFMTNVLGTFHVLEAARAAGVGAFIYSSSMSVYGVAESARPVAETQAAVPRDWYGQTKLWGEELCRRYAREGALRAVALRYSGLFGPARRDGAVANFFQAARAHQPIRLAGNTVWNIISARDAAQANVLAFHKIKQVNGQALNIGSREQVSTRQLAAWAVAITRSNSPVLAPRKGATLRIPYSTARARRLLAFSPPPLRASLEQYWQTLQRL